MTYLPKAELVGVFAPYSINIRDIGNNWLDLGDITTGIGIISIAYLGNGIAIFGTSDGHIWKSTDYGNNWSDLGVQTSAVAISSISYLGDGIVIIGNQTGILSQIWRSTDFGSNWSLVALTLSDVNTIAYFGNNGTVVAGTADGHIWRSTDYGLNWIDIGNVVGIGIQIFSISYLENGIAVLGASDGNIWRTINFGPLVADWTNLGFKVTGPFTSSYLGNGIVLFGGLTGGIIRSIDFGATWTNLGVIGASFQSTIYLGNGAVLFGEANGNIWRSIDFGLTWTNIVNIGTIVRLRYIGNGIVIAGSGSGHIWRSDIAYKLDEAQVLLEKPVRLTATDITVGQSHRTVLVDASGGARIITLDDAQLPRMIGHEFTIVKIDSSFNTVTIATVNNRTINSYLNPTLDVQWQTMTVISDGSNWIII